jgi:hypothetical protein
MSEPAMSCPSCGRPVAVARASCLYCGAALPEAAVRQAEAHTRELLAAPGLAGETAAGPERTLLVLDLEGADAAAVASALGLSAYEASQRVRAGGLQLHRVVDAAEAEGERKRLRDASLVVHLVSEAEIRESAPLPVLGGDRGGDGRLHLRDEHGEHVVAGADVLLVVKGPIARAVPPAPEIRRLRVAAPEPGYRVHLHRRATPRPLEIDPEDFDFGPQGPLAGSSLLELMSWVEALAPPEAVDDRFRRLPPVFAPAAAERSSLRGALASRAPGADQATLRLDNLGQFRHYSGWRAVIERQRRGVLPSAPAE